MQPRKTPYLSMLQVPDYTPMGYARDAIKVAVNGKLTEGVSIEQARKNLFGQHNPGRTRVP